MYSWVIKVRNTSEAVLGPQLVNIPLGHHSDSSPMALVSILAQGSVVALILPPLSFF